MFNDNSFAGLVFIDQFLLFCKWLLFGFFNRVYDHYCTSLSGDIIALDGKTVRGSYGAKSSAIHIVSAWSANKKVVLAQEKALDKSGELTAIPKLLNRLPIEGATVTIDALGCQIEIAREILKNNANYVLSLKANQPNLFNSVQMYFTNNLLNSATKCGKNFFSVFDGKKEKMVRRSIWVIRNISFLKNKDKWPGLKSVIALETIKYNSKDIRFFISNLDVTAEMFARIIRSHWGIENLLHWSLDVSFREDASRLRYGNSAQNFSLFRKMALNLIRNHQTYRGILARRKCAGWDNNFLDAIMTNKKRTKVDPSSVLISDLFLSPAKHKEWSESIR